MSPREPEHIQREIESSRADLASTLDTLAEKVSPKRLADEARESATSFLQTPPGMALVGALTLLVALGFSRRARNRRS